MLENGQIYRHFGNIFLYFHAKLILSAIKDAHGIAESPNKINLQNIYIVDVMTLYFENSQFYKFYKLRPL